MKALDPAYPRTIWCTRFVILQEEREPLHEQLVSCVFMLPFKVFSLGLTLKVGCSGSYIRLSIACVNEVVLWLCPSLGWSDSPSGLSVRLLCWRPVLADKSSGTGMASSWSSPPSIAVGLSLPEQRVEKLPI